MGYLRHTAKTQCFLALIFFQLFLLSSPSRADVIPDAQESHPGLADESRYDEAVIAYNKKQTQKALMILDELLGASPKNKEYLEMKALALKDKGDPKQSLSVYLRLYELATKSERGPYAFEVGSLYFQLGKLDLARPYFQKAADLKFNTVASEFYLGLLAFQNANYAEAEKNFLVASDSNLPPFTVMSRYYLGICYFKLNNGPQGVQQLVEVRKLTRGDNQDEATKTIGVAANKMLAPFALGQWFGNLVLQSQYDSNVQQLPAGAANPTGGTNPATMKMNFSGGGGYMTAPLNPIQFVAGYRATYNYNLNPSTKGFEYFTNDATMYLNYQALASTSAGIKMESTFAFQNSLVDPSNPTGAYSYQRYDFTYGGGAYYHWQLNRKWRLEAEVGARAQTFYSDPDLSGPDYTARVSLRSDLGRAYFNPGASLVFENDHAVSDEFYYSSTGVGLMNSMRFPGAITFLQSVDLLFSDYTKSSPVRLDKNLTVRLSGVKLLNPKFSLLADISYIDNNSTIATTYSYTEFLTSLGIGYTF